MSEAVVDLETDAAQMVAHRGGVDVGAEQAVDLRHSDGQGRAVRRGAETRRWCQAKRLRRTRR